MAEQWISELEARHLAEALAEVYELVHGQRNFVVGRLGDWSMFVMTEPQNSLDFHVELIVDRSDPGSHMDWRSRFIDADVARQVIEQPSLLYDAPIDGRTPTKFMRPNFPLPSLPNYIHAPGAIHEYPSIACLTEQETVDDVVEAMEIRHPTTAQAIAPCTIRIGSFKRESSKAFPYSSLLLQFDEDILAEVMSLAKRANPELLRFAIAGDALVVEVAKESHSIYVILPTRR